MGKGLGSTERTFKYIESCRDHCEILAKISSSQLFSLDIDCASSILGTLDNNFFSQEYLDKFCYILKLDLWILI